MSRTSIDRATVVTRRFSIDESQTSIDEIDVLRRVLNCGARSRCVVVPRVLPAEILESPHELLVEGLVEADRDTELLLGWNDLRERLLVVRRQLELRNAGATCDLA